MWVSGVSVCCYKDKFVFCCVKLAIQKPFGFLHLVPQVLENLSFCSLGISEFRFLPVWAHCLRFRAEETMCR